MSRLPIIAVVGATATGKSELGVGLAQRLGGEVINADALQLYRGMDVGTAKITPAERRGIDHHLLDVLDITEEASVSAYQREGRAAIAAIRAAGRVPVVVGGSGLYVRALLDRISFPPADPRIRAEVEAEAAAQGTAALHSRLRSIDPEAAAHIGEQDTRRIVRALEVNRITGASFRSFLPRPVHVDPGTLVLGIQRERPLLHARIAARTRGMLEGGLLEETRGLRARGLDSSPTARRAIGYEQALAVLDGEMSEGEAEAAISAGTRRLVRKQDTWFRRDLRVRWIDGSDDPAGTLEHALDIHGRWASDEDARGTTGPEGIGGRGHGSGPDG